MKLEELMLNDWVLYNENPCKVARISERLFLEKDGKVFYAPIEKISPLPLTAEILEKNGWKWNTFYTMIELVVGTIHIGWGFYKDCISVSDHSAEGHCQISSLRCEYVHELQHALRLCGIEKAINL